MRHAPRQIGRATAIATGIVALAFITAGLAYADTVSADTDLVTAGNQGIFDLGTFAPGATVDVAVRFQLVCKGLAHVDHGETVTLAFDSATVPPGGAATGLTDGTLGPVLTWPGDGTSCFSPPQVLSAGTAATAELTAPDTDGSYRYDLLYTPSVSNGDDAAVTSLMIFASYTLRVVSNTPPHLALPADIAVEGNTIGGATVTYAASATDAEDSPAPTPVCAPSGGSVFGLGTTTVNCAVTDSGGLADTGSFSVSVSDTTPPSLSGVPGDISVGTSNPAGSAVTWTDPTATDIVDSAPTVACVPASGAVFPVGTTAVTCTATDASGNPSQATFHVTVDLYSATFDSPIGPSNALSLNGNRSLPVKARLWTNGVEQKAGAVRVDVTSCSGGAVVATANLTWSDANGGRWTGKLDLSGLADGCYHATIRFNGQAAGSFDLNGPAAAKSSARTKS
jgi:hypothetical protein